jgi:hypothetical protein
MKHSLRNSHDKMFPAGVVAGASVFVRVNLSFSGEAKLAGKHTRFIVRDLPGLVAAGIGRMLEKWHDQATVPFSLPGLSAPSHLLPAIRYLPPAGALPMVTSMKRGKSRRNPSTDHPRHKNGSVTDRRIVPVSDGPLRKRAAKECNRAMGKLDRARGELRRFEQEDRPLFGRWMAATFGALLTEIRDNARLISEQEALIEEVEMEMMWSNHRNPRRAYAAVLKRRENPDPDDDFAEEDQSREEAGHPKHGPADSSHDARGDEGKDADDFGPFEEMGAEIPKEERQALFDDFLRSVLGINPKQMSKADYTRMFAEFEAELFGKRPEANYFQIPDEKKPMAGREEVRIKEIYRILVRRLHPDSRAGGDGTVSAIWHEVQEAYQARKLDRLETLLALTEMQSGANGGQASLSQMHGALEELNRAFRAIQRSLGQAKRDPAWGFTRNTYHGPMEKRIRREMEESLSQQRSALADLKRTLDQWSRPWHPPAKKPRRQSKPPAKPKAEESRHQFNVPEPVQTEFFAFR